MTSTPVEKVSQEEMLKNFQDRFQKLIDENQKLAAKIKENEQVALKLQGAIEALEYYQENPPTPETEVMAAPDIPADDITDQE
tara:strand:+ start:416 stop:664 length:249 start_codon:yes stop_codon:yes gene_type:complete